MRVNDIFRAKPAADERHSEAHVLGSHFEEMSDFVGVAKRCVGGPQKIDLSIREARDTAADVLHWMVKHRRRTVGLYEDAVRLRESLVDIAPLKFVFQKQIGFLLFVHER